jgi:hypothetical protein
MVVPLKVFFFFLNFSNKILDGIDTLPYQPHLCTWQEAPDGAQVKKLKPQSGKLSSRVMGVLRLIPESWGSFLCQKEGCHHVAIRG